MANEFIIKKGFHSKADSQVTGSLTATSFVGDGSGLTGVGAFPFTGSAEITGSLNVIGPFTASLVDIESLPLINPLVEYITTTALTSSGDTVTTPDALTFVSSSTYEYLEIFINGLRLRYDVDFAPASTGSVKYFLTIPSGAEVIYKSLKRPV